MKHGKYRIGVDIGGTFTDFTLVDEVTGEVLVEKCLTTPEAPHQAVLAGLERYRLLRGDAVAAANTFVHASTLFTNTVLERNGAVTGLLTTSGFRDILEIGRESKYEVYNAFIAFPRPIVPRNLRLEARERVLADGSVRLPLQEEDVEAAARAFREAGVTSVAIAFLHSYRNRAHEQRAAEILSQLLPSVALSLSSDVLPEPREYERTSTTVVNAYIKPIAVRYLDDMEQELRRLDFRHTPYMMQSNGGAATFALTKQYPVQAVESGPAAGVEAVGHYGQLTGRQQLLSFDMGGTTAKLCVVLEGRPFRTRTFEVDRMQRFKAGSGIPIATPVYDLLEIGSGGGSIAGVDGLGLLRVGPESASSVPGPACYGRGGTRPTVTDANLVLGYLGADSFLGGEMKLDMDAAQTAILEHVAGRLGVAIEEAAWGIYDLVNETMASAARVHIAEKGQHAGDLVLVGFGGAGPLHAVELARKLGCALVMIPPLPGVMSSFGLLTAPVTIERTRTVRRMLEEVDASELKDWLVTMEREAAVLLGEGEAPTFARIAELWRKGQDYAVEVRLPASFVSLDARAEIAKAFESTYSAVFGNVDDGTPPELVTLRVRAARLGAPPRVRFTAAAGSPRIKERRRTFVPAKRAYCEVPVYDRGSLASGVRVTGPAVIEERESTTVIGAGDDLCVDALGCLVVTLAR